MLLIVLLICAWLSWVAFAPYTQPRHFASVVKLQGTVQAITAGNPRILRVGDVIYMGESVRTDAASSAELQSNDGSSITLRPNSELVTEALAKRGKATDYSIMHKSPLN